VDGDGVDEVVLLSGPLSLERWDTSASLVRLVEDRSVTVANFGRVVDDPCPSGSSSSLDEQRKWVVIHALVSSSGVRFVSEPRTNPCHHTGDPTTQLRVW